MTAMLKEDTKDTEETKDDVSLDSYITIDIDVVKLWSIREYEETKTLGKDDTNLFSMINDVIQAIFKQVMSGSFYGADNIIMEHLSSSQKQGILLLSRGIASIYGLTNIVDLIIPEQLSKLKCFDKVKARLLDDVLTAFEHNRDQILLIISKEKWKSLMSCEYSFEEMLDDKDIHRTLGWSVLSVLLEVFRIFNKHEEELIHMYSNIIDSYVKSDNVAEQMIGKRLYNACASFASLLLRSLELNDSEMEYEMKEYGEESSLSKIPEYAKSHPFSLMLWFVTNALDVQSLSFLTMQGRGKHIMFHERVLAEGNGVLDILPTFEFVMKMNSKTSPFAPLLCKMIRSMPKQREVELPNTVSSRILDTYYRYAYRTDVMGEEKKPLQCTIM